MKKYCLCITLICLTVALIFGQSVKNFSPTAKPEDAGLSTERLARIDKMLEEHIKNKWIPGAVVLIVRNGKIAYHKAYGYSNISKKRISKTMIFFE
jgi:CubicO group peptidase (beta-lactamase class C family)